MAWMGPEMTDRTPFITKRRLVGACLVLALGLGLLLPYLMLGDLPTFSEAWVRKEINDLGAFGPAALVLFMALAIVVSPIPSGPIGVAAGAIYGTLLGGVLTVVGAFLGACIAFLCARYLGFDAIRQSENRVLKALAAPRPQWSLMAIVFASRLIPFISFDAVSYAAGLTALTLPRFALATLLGVIPVSFVLTAIGAGLHEAEMSKPLLALIGGITLLPVIGKWLWDKLR
jgi:uncharacterized membrane protein YdjX (TVP38/TMEM64 family)